MIKLSTSISLTLFCLFLCLGACKSKKKLIQNPSNQAQNQENPVKESPNKTPIDIEQKVLTEAEINQKIEEMMQHQMEDLRRYLKDAEITKINNGIQVSFDPGVLFDFDKSNLTPIAKVNIADLSVVLNKYPFTTVQVDGHTDSDGKDDYNMKLSIRRANSFADFAVLKGVDADRFTAKGYGETRPKASNATPEGRRANRRIDATILATPDLYKRVAAGEQIEFSKKISNAKE